MYSGTYLASCVWVVSVQGPLAGTEDQRWTKNTWAVSYCVVKEMGISPNNQSTVMADEHQVKAGRANPLNEAKENRPREPSKEQKPHSAGQRLPPPDPGCPSWPAPEEGPQEEADKDFCPEALVTRCHNPAWALAWPLYLQTPTGLSCWHSGLTLSSPLLLTMKTPRGPFRSHARKLPLLITMK